MGQLYCKKGDQTWDQGAKKGGTQQSNKGNQKGLTQMVTEQDQKYEPESEGRGGVAPAKKSGERAGREGGRYEKGECWGYTRRGARGEARTVWGF